MPDSFADLADEQIPTVVNISTTQTVKVGRSPFGGLMGQEYPEGHPFADLPDIFKHFYGMPRGGKQLERKTQALGSGFVIDPSGYIVTNNHVIEQADEITVIFHDDFQAKAKVVGHDSKTDLALLKIDVDRKLTAANWGDSDKARVGDWVVAIGNPFGLGGSVSAGIISARARDINSGPFDDFIQTDAAINRGNSGGPLFNTDGKVIGVATAIFSPTGGNVGIGFAVPSALAKTVISQLREYGKTQRGWLGIKIQTVTEDVAESLGLDDAEGALVVEVTPDSPASKAGVEAGDIILSFDDQNVDRMRQLPRIVAETKIGKTVNMDVLREGSNKTLKVKVGELEEEGSELADNDSDDKREESDSTETKEIAGMNVIGLTSDLRKRYGIEGETKGVLIVSVDPESDAAEKQLARGDIIISVNQKDVTDVKALEKLIDKAKDQKRRSVLLMISRGGDKRFVAVSVAEK